MNLESSLHQSVIISRLWARWLGILDLILFALVACEIDKGIARLKLEAMGVRIDTLTEAQVKYLGSWEEGT